MYEKNTRSNWGSKDRTKDNLENRVNKKSQLGFPSHWPKADWALGFGK